MKKMIQSLWLLFLFTSLSALAQRTITGTVTNSKDGNPIEGASLYVVGTQIMQKTNDKGSFTIQIPQELIKKSIVIGVSAKGFKSEKVDASSDNLTISLDDNSQKVDEVIVTAQGIKRKKNTLPFAAQQVTGEEISNTRTNNFVSNLSGKAAGIEIRQSNTMGGSTNVVIRGNKSLTGNNQALFVVDGIPYFNSDINEDNQKRGRGGYDYGNTAADINPDDIENITVLKGAAASALYGSNASNGVVMVTTKKGTKGKKGLGVSFQTGATFGFTDASTFLKYQDQYGAGYSPTFTKTNYFNTASSISTVRMSHDASYGPAFNQNLSVYQYSSFDPTSPNYGKTTPWVAAQNTPFSFLESSTSLNNSIFVTGGGDVTFFKFGYTRNDDWGILPNSKINKNAFNLSGSYQILKNLTLSANVQYTVTEGTGRYGTGYDSKNVMTNFRQWWQTNVDIQDQKDAYYRTGKNATWNISTSNTLKNPYKPVYWDNPYWTRYQNYQNDKRNRVFGYAQMVYQPISSLTVTGRASVDYYDLTQEERVAIGSNGLNSLMNENNQISSGYAKSVTTNTAQNYDLITNFDRDLNKDINFKALLGFNLRRLNYSMLGLATNGGIIVPNIYSFSNSVNSLNPPSETQYISQTNSMYGGFTFTFQEMLTLDATLRGDASSTLPVNNNMFFYPSVSAGFIFSKWNVFQNGFLNPKSTFGKLRLNYAEVGNAAPPLSIINTYSQNSNFGSSASFSSATTNNNPNLKPERSKSWEVGLEMSFANNRVGFDATYYNTKSIDQIMPVSISTATGFSKQYVNAGEMSNEGVELSLWGVPVKTSDWTWDINLNFTKNKNTVLSLYSGVENLQLASLQGGVSINATPGQAYGSIRGEVFEMINGQKLVDETGHYVKSTTNNNVIGNAQPNWLMGLQNKISYKNLSLSYLIDVRSGGQIFSLDMYYGLATGLPVETANLNELGNPVRNSIANGGGILLDGLDKNGNKNTVRADGNEYGVYGEYYNPNSAFVYDASYVKLREVVLTYKLPKRILGKSFVKDASFSLFSRNLWIIYKNLPYADPEDMLSAGNVQGYQSGAYPNVRTFGFNLKIGF